MKSRDEIEAELQAIGWKLIDGPTRTSSGWKATSQRGTESMLTTGSTEIGVLGYLLRSAQAEEER